MMHKQFLAPAAALLLLAACETQTAQPTSTAAMAPNQAEVGFTNTAYQIITFDREEGILAQNDAKNPKVKALAEQLTRQANDFADQLGPTAAAAGIRPPTVLRNDLRVRLGHMRLQQGLDFDRAYVADQIASHEEAISMRNGMTGAGASPKFMELMSKGDMLLRDNLEQLRALQREMGPPSR